MLDVFAQQASNERAAGPKDWITALEGESGSDSNCHHSSMLVCHSLYSDRTRYSRSMPTCLSASPLSEHESLMPCRRVTLALCYCSRSPCAHASLEGSGDEAEAAAVAPTSAMLARKSADSFKFRASLRTSVRNKRKGGMSAFGEKSWDYKLFGTCTHTLAVCLSLSLGLSLCQSLCRSLSSLNYLCFWSLSLSLPPMLLTGFVSRSVSLL